MLTYVPTAGHWSGRLKIFSKKLFVAFAYRELIDICSMICDLFTFFVTISSFPRCLLSAFVDAKLLFFSFSSCVKQRQSHSRTFRRNIRPKFRFILTNDREMCARCARMLMVVSQRSNHLNSRLLLSINKQFQF